MADPIIWNRKVVLAKLESGGYGVDAAPTGALNAILFKNLSIQPMEGQDVVRNLERPYQGNQEVFPTGLYVVLTGEVELVPSGTAGTAPAWGPLMRMCGSAETIVATTSVTYSSISEAHESGSIYIWIGLTRHVITGVRGTAEIALSAQNIPVIRFTLTGLFTTPGQLPRPTPLTYTAWQTPQVATNANTPIFTIGGTAFVLLDYRFALGNQVERRFLPGRQEVIIVDCNETLATRVEAQSTTVLNPFTQARDRVQQEVKLRHGTGAGKIVTVTHPTAQMLRPPGYENSQNITEWPLRFNPLPNAGNDQWSIACT